MDPLFPLAALCIGAAVGLLARFGRDPKADVHDLSDYHEPMLPESAYGEVELWEDVHMAEEMVPAGYEVLPPWDDDILPPAPPGTDAGGSPLYAGMLFDTWQRERWGTTDAEVIAGRMLWEIAEDEQAKAGIGPDGHAWQLDGSCWSDCPACARDLTGAFPMARAA